MRATALMMGLVVSGCLGGEYEPQGGSGDQDFAYQYVQSGLVLPMGSAATNGAVDLDGNGSLDNRFGSVLGALGGFGLDLQAQADQAIQSGQVIVLHGLAASALDGDVPAMWKVFLGNSTTTPDFSGNGAFTVAEESPDDAVLTGRLHQGTFEGGPDPVRIYTAIADVPVVFNLVGARMTGTVTEDGCDLSLAGGILQTQIQASLVPAAATIITNWATDDPMGAQGLMDVIDLDHDGTVTPEELSSNAIVHDLLEPDVDLIGHDGTADALSMSMGLRCVRATF